MADEDEVYRRVANPNPLLEELARQVVDRLERWRAEGLVVQLSTTIALAAEAGVPLEYIYAERERRVRQTALNVDGLV